MKKLIIGLIAFVFVFVVGYQILWFSTAREVSIKINNTERIVETSGSGNDASITSKYLIYTDIETFENTDVTLLGKWDSSDLQGKLHKDSTYKAVVYGWRVPFFSMYRNVIKVK
jgi:hypothetical protein